MSKFYGPIGFAKSQETFPGSGIWENVVVEKNYRGDIIKNIKKYDVGQQLNDNININNSISIVFDTYASANFHAIKYVKWSGVYWEVNTIDINPPRLVLNIGGVYNGPKAETSAGINEHPRH